MFGTQDHYPSRVGRGESITERIDPVVYGSADWDSPHALSQAQLEDFERNGFLVLPESMPEQVEPLLQELEHLQITMAGKEELISEPDSEEPRTLFAVHRFSKLMDQVSRDPRVLDPVTQLLGSDAYIMQSRLNIKPAYKGRSFPWHSDFETWHVEDGMPRMRAVTAWLMLTDNDEYNGPLYAIPGSHRKFVSCEGTTRKGNHEQSLRRQIAGVPRPESIDELIREQGIQSIHGQAGTLVIHECNLLHGSPDNISPRPRSLLMFVYNSVENAMRRPFSGLDPRPEYLSCRAPEPVKPLARSLRVDRAACARRR